MWFVDREEAGRRLAKTLRPLLEQGAAPLVCGIPRGGVVVAATLAGELRGELRALLAQKITLPAEPELAVGAVNEAGEILWNLDTLSYFRLSLPRDLPKIKPFIEKARRELERRQALYQVAPFRAPAGQTVIVTDDGIATGQTCEAALQGLRSVHRGRLILAVPVAAPASLRRLSRWVDEAVCLLTPRDFGSVGQYYADFRQVTDEEVRRLLGLGG